jgi:hypothetical protein
VRVNRFGVALSAVVVLAVLGIVAASLAGADGAPPVIVSLLVLAALVWNMYWWLLRIALSVRIDGDSLVAKTILLTRRVELDDVVAVRPMGFVSIITVLELVAGRPVLMMASTRVSALARDLRSRRPDLPVKLSWQAHLEERIRGGPTDL